MENPDMKVSLKRKAEKGSLECSVCSKVYIIKKYFDKHVASHELAKVKPAIARKGRTPEEQQCGTLAPEELTTEELFDDEPYFLNEDEVLMASELSDKAEFLLSLEEKDEDLRHIQGTAENSNEKGNMQKLKNAPRKCLVKCPTCKANFFSLDGYIKHKRVHVFAGICTNIPSSETIHHNSANVMAEALKEIIQIQPEAGFGPTIVAACNRLLTTDSEEWKSFICSVTETLCQFLSCKEDFTLPSTLKENFLKWAIGLARDQSERTEFCNKVRTVISESEPMYPMLFGSIIRLYSKTILAMVLRHMNKQGSDALVRLSETFAQTSQSTDNLDFKQNMHYIGGANLKSIIRKGLQIKNPDSRTLHIIKIVKSQFLVGDFSNSPDSEMMAWTLRQDRGSFLKINTEALDLFVSLGCIVKPLEHFDGSLILDEVLEKVASNPDFLTVWDKILHGYLTTEESFQLLYWICYYFCNTWRRGIVTRRLDELSEACEAPKHGTQGVSFRAKLSV